MGACGSEIKEEGARLVRGKRGESDDGERAQTRKDDRRRGVREEREERASGEQERSCCLLLSAASLASAESISAQIEKSDQLVSTHTWSVASGR